MRRYLKTVASNSQLHRTRPAASDRSGTRRSPTVSRYSKVSSRSPATARSESRPPPTSPMSSSKRSRPQAARSKELTDDTSPSTFRPRLSSPRTRSFSLREISGGNTQVQHGKSFTAPTRDWSPNSAAAADGNRCTILVGATLSHANAAAGKPLRGAVTRQPCDRECSLSDPYYFWQPLLTHNGRHALHRAQRLNTPALRLRQSPKRCWS